MSRLDDCERFFDSQMKAWGDVSTSAALYDIAKSLAVIADELRKLNEVKEDDD